jgi:phosphomevalonate kinase
VTGPNAHLEVWAAGEPASTAGLLGLVRAFAARDRAHYDRILRELCDAAEVAERAINERDGTGFIRALERQLAGLTDLGAAAGAPIVTPAATHLAEVAAREGGVVLPAGAGGGDIVLFAGLEQPSPALRRAARSVAHRNLELGLGARGVHLVGGAASRAGG